MGTLSNRLLAIREAQAGGRYARAGLGYVVCKLARRSRLAVNTGGSVGLLGVVLSLGQCRPDGMLDAPSASTCFGVERPTHPQSSREEARHR